MSRKILAEFQSLAVWSRGGQRAPHKPLLILYALGELLRGKERLLFSDLENPLAQLLMEFGPQRAAYHPSYPFCRLVTDGVWLLKNDELCESRASNTDLKVTELREHKVTGGLRSDLKDALRASPALVSELITLLLDSHFPETLHDELLEACGLQLYLKPKSKRDPTFRNRVLKAYQYRCAVCRLQIQMNGIHLGLEAAHIKWHAAGGPDSESNGLAMCALHHKLFDRGAFTILKGKISVSESVYGNNGFDEFLLKYNGTDIDRPVSKSYMPGDDYFTWHASEVFKSPARDVIN